MTLDPPVETAELPLTLLVTGPSGAGRSTAVNALEDIGFEAIDNLPLSLLPRLLDGPVAHPLVLGLDVRNRDFGTNALIAAIDKMTSELGSGAQVVYLDANDDVLLRRYSETRRRHPLSPEGAPLVGITQDKELLAPVRARADFLIDTSQMSPHELKAEMVQLFSPNASGMLAVSVHSFSFKRGMPRGLDMVLDCRFLRNPHWDPELRSKDGREEAVVSYISEDERYEPFLAQVADLVDLVLPGHKAEGRAHMSIGFGCTGGQHRSVAMTELLAERLKQAGWPVTKRHRELERRGETRSPMQQGRNV